MTYLTLWFSDYITLFLSECSKCLTVFIFDSWLSSCLTVDVWLSDGLTVWLFDCLTIWLSEYPAVCISDYLTVWLYDCLPIWLFDCLTTLLSDCLAIWLSDCLTVWLCDCLNVCYSSFCSDTKVLLVSQLESDWPYSLTVWLSDWVARAGSQALRFGADFLSWNWVLGQLTEIDTRILQYPNTSQTQASHGMQHISVYEISITVQRYFSSKRPTGPIRSSSRKVCVSVFDAPFHVLDFEASFAPTSRSRMFKIVRDSESLGKSAWKKWSQKWTFLLGCSLKSPQKKS